MSVLKNLGCNIPEPDEDYLNRAGMEPDELTEIQRRLANLDALVQAHMTAGTPNPRTSNSNATKTILFQNMERANEISRAVHLRPEMGRGIQQFLARDLGVAHQAFGLGDNFTDAGWVRESLNRAQRLWRGGLTATLRDMQVAERMGDLWKQAHDRLRPYRLHNNELDLLMSDVTEIGWVPDIINDLPINSNGREALIGKVENLQRLAERLGISPEDTKFLMDTGAQVARIYREVGEVAWNAGINLQEVDILGYFPRILSDEARQRFNWRWEDEGKGLFTWNTGERGTVSSAIQRSRNTYEFIAEDELVLDYVFRTLSDRDYGSPTKLYELATGSSGAGIADVLGDRRALESSLIHLLSNHPTVIDHLVDNRIISKIPMLSSEVFQRMRNVYEFPFSRLRQVFQTDWRRGWQLYERQLEHLASRSGFVQVLTRNAIDGHWGVSAADFNANPARYEGFRRLTDVIPESMMPPGSQHLQPHTVYVHPVVADLAHASLKMQINPNTMGAVARTIHGISRTFRQLALSTVEYIPRQVWNTFVALGAGGGNILRLPGVLTKTMLSQITGQSMESFLDNTRAVYRTLSGENLTELGVWNYLQDIGYIGRWEPLTGDPLHPGHFSAWNPASVWRTLRDHGMMRTLEAAGLQASSLLDKATYPIRWSNQWTDTAGRFAGVLSTLSGENDIPELLVRAGTTGSTVRHNTVEEAVEHWKNYYYMYDDMTAVNQSLSRYVIPFWGFHSKNLPAAVRHAVRNPSRYIAYQRLYALANAPVANDERINEATAPEWMLHSSTIFFRLPNGEYFGIPMQSIDPFASAYSFIQRPAEAAAHMLGINVPVTRTTGERLDTLDWNSTRTNRAIESVMEETYPLWQALAATVRGTDNFNRPIFNTPRTTSFLGYETSPLFRLWAETLLPITGTINRYNPHNIFGTADRRDPWTGTVQLGEPSRMPFSGGVHRSDGDSFYDSRNPFQALQVLGIKIYPVDWALNAGYTYDDLRINIREGERFISGMERDMLQMPEDSEVRRRKEQEIAELRYLIEVTRQDMNRLEDWAKTQGLNVLDAAGRLREDNIRIGDMPDGRQHDNQRQRN